MAAAYVKGKRFVVGRNQNRIPGHLKHADYPVWMGFHCESALLQACNYIDLDISGGTLYIVGVKKKNNIAIDTTRPCQFCSRVIVRHMNPRFIVFFYESRLIKMRFRDWEAFFHNNIPEDIYSYERVS